MEENKYEEIIKRYNDFQLLCEEVIVEEEESIIYNKKKALREERKRRVRSWWGYL